MRNEAVNEERLIQFTAQGGEVVECYPVKNTQLGSILDFSTEVQKVRIAAGEAAGAAALARAKTASW
jgi:hypothetical protein